MRVRIQKIRPVVRRRGALSVEFALVTPLLFLMTFAAVEFARLNMLINSMENAVYEGTRRGIVPGATSAQVEQEVQRILNAVGAVNGEITVTPAVITNATPQVTVSVELPLDDNAWVVPRFTRQRTVERSCTLTKERAGR